ncbi:MAG: hypothetical protein AAB587_02740 [Patescibacteria group bacterium]
MSIDKNITLSDNTKEEGSQKKDYFTSFFKDSRSLFIFKKTEKISTALYLITSLMSDDEPLKKSIRQTALTLLNASLAVKDNSSNGKDEVMRKIKTTLFDLLSLLALGERSKQLSSMNYSVMEREISGLIEYIISSGNHYSEPSSISEDFFSVSVPTIAPQALDTGLLKDSTYKGQGNMSNAGVNVFLKKKILEINSIKKQPESDILSVKKDKRRNQILDIIKIKKQVSIKDISIIIKDCSEKTIQRELISLVSEGVVKKEGERRWSMYAIA